MSNIDNVLMKFNNGHTCSQAIFSTYARKFGMPEETALKISCPFGGGMGCLGKTCGAVTGALMVIGLKYGRVSPDDIDSRQLTDSFVEDFVIEFERRNSSIICNELIGCDRNDESEVAKAKADGVFERVCTKAVKDAVEILEAIL